MGYEMHLYIDSDDLDFYSVGFSKNEVKSLSLYLPTDRMWRDLLSSSVTVGSGLVITIDSEMVFRGTVSGIDGRVLALLGKLVSEERTLWSKA